MKVTKKQIDDEDRKELKRLWMEYPSFQLSTKKLTRFVRRNEQPNQPWLWFVGIILD